MRQIKNAVMLLLVMTVLTGAVYPLAVTVLAQRIFPSQANGSLVLWNGRAVGSELIGQSFSEPEYFWGRLSATGPVPYNAAASSGSNYGPLHPALKEAVTTRVAQLKTAGAPADAPVPVDLVTASGSGLDPHISPAAAFYQAPRIAKARGLTDYQVNELIRRNTQGRWLGLIGEPTVNVLKLNLILDAHDQREIPGLKGAPRHEALPKFMKWSFPSPSGS